jgi:hypothetical protein
MMTLDYAFYAPSVVMMGYKVVSEEVMTKLACVHLKVQAIRLPLHTLMKRKREKNNAFLLLLHLQEKNVSFGTSIKFCLFVCLFAFLFL